ncbi:MAG TPA: hypothetical protein VMR39_09370, partial [Sphingobium sp.]
SLRQLGRLLPQLDQVRDPQLRIHALVEASYLHNEIGQYSLGMQYAERILASQPDARAKAQDGARLRDQACSRARRHSANESTPEEQRGTTSVPAGTAGNAGRSCPGRRPLGP